MIGGGRCRRKASLPKTLVSTSYVGSLLRPPFLCADSALSLFHSRTTIRFLPFPSPSHVDKSPSFAPPSFLFIQHCLGRFSAPGAPSLGQSLNPLAEFSDHPETLQLPLTGILTISGLQRKSDKRYNRDCSFSTTSFDLLSGLSFDLSNCALVTF